MASLCSSTRACGSALSVSRSRATRQAYAAIRKLSSEASPEEHDVVIVGGGPVGLALASALGSQPIFRDGLKLALIEAGDLSKVREWSPAERSFSNRVSSITNSSQAFLTRTGAWQYVEHARTVPVHQMQVWDGVSNARIHFDARDLPLDMPPECSQMARMTENLNLQRALLRHLASVPNVSVLDRVKVESIESNEYGWPLVHLSDGRVLQARLLVGADGFNSPVRSYAQIPSYGWSYETQAIVATLEHAPRGPADTTPFCAFQRFLPTGPIAFLPMSPTTSSLVWSTKPHIAAALTKTSPDILLRMTNAAFRLPEASMRDLYDQVIAAAADPGAPLSPEKLVEEIAWRERSHSIPSYSAYASATAKPTGGIPPDDADMVPPLVTAIQPGTIASFPLRYNHAEYYVGEGKGRRTVLVGDAAHSVHPLAGQGLNLGLGDAEALSKCITEQLVRGGDIGSYTALLPYARERYFENHKIMSAVDKLQKLYTTTAEPIVWLRSVGLEVINELDTVKAALMMGAGAGSANNLGASGLEFVASGYQGLGRAAIAVKAVGESVATSALTGLKSLLDDASRRIPR